MTTTTASTQQSMSVRFNLPDGTTFRVTQRQLDQYLDTDPDSWYAILDYAVWEPSEPIKEKVMPKKSSPKKSPKQKTVTVDAKPVVDWDKEWQEVAKMFDEFYATPVEKPVKRVTNARKHAVSRSTLDSKARVLEYMDIKGDYTVSKLRTAWKNSPYADHCDEDIRDLKLNKAESWDMLWNAIKDFHNMSKDYQAAAKYETRIKLMKVADLKAECKNLGLSGYSKMKKQELIEFILDSQRSI